MKKNNNKGRSISKIKKETKGKSFPVERAKKLRSLGRRKGLLVNKVCSPLLDGIGKSLGLNRELAAVYAAFFAVALDHSGLASIDEVADRHGLKDDKKLALVAKTEKLVQAGLALVRGKSKRSLLLGSVLELDALAFTEVLHGEESDSHVDFDDPFAVISETEHIFGLCHDRDISRQTLFVRLNRLAVKSTGRNVLGEWFKGLPPEEEAILFKAVLGMTLHDPSFELFDVFAECRMPLAIRGRFLKQVEEKRTLVGRRRLVEFKMDERTGDFSFRLGEKAASKLLPCRWKHRRQSEDENGKVAQLRPYPKKRKVLFLEPKLAAELESLENACKPDEFRRFRQGLKKAGLPPGLTILLHGAPGTGKTVAAFNLAHVSHRPILQVDMSQVRDKYVGESEKRVKAVFDQWRGACNTKGPAPLLLLNEADALVGRRVAVGHSVDQMHNIMQNVLLEELEHFDGILIATSNMIDNIDNAFDRRFLFKLRFDPPGIEERRHIWQSRMPDLHVDWLSRLSSYPLSGAQIENIARRALLNGLLRKRPDLAKLEAMAVFEESFRAGKRNVTILGFVPELRGNADKEIE